MTATKPVDNGLSQMDAITIITMLREMNDGLMAQAKATNNSVAAILRSDVQLHETIKQLIASLTETRDKRYQQEIDELEQQMSVMLKALEEKKAAKHDNLSTSDKLQAAATKAVTDLQEQEKKRRSIDWYDVRNTMVKAAAGAAAVALVIFIANNAPAIGELIRRIFGD